MLERDLRPEHAGADRKAGGAARHRPPGDEGLDQVDRLVLLVLIGGRDRPLDVPGDRPVPDQFGLGRHRVDVDTVPAAAEARAAEAAVGPGALAVGEDDAEIDHRGEIGGQVEMRRIGAARARSRQAPPSPRRRRQPASFGSGLQTWGFYAAILVNIAFASR